MGAMFSQIFTPIINSQNEKSEKMMELLSAIDKKLDVLLKGPDTIQIEESIHIPLLVEQGILLEKKLDEFLDPLIVKKNNTILENHSLILSRIEEKLAESRVSKPLFSSLSRTKPINKKERY